MKVEEARALARSVAEAVDAGRLWRDVETLTRWDRHSGGEGERQAAAYVVEQLRAAGVAAEIREFDSLISLPGPARLEIVAPEAGELTCKTHSFAASTPPGGVEAEAVWVDDAPPRVDGRILVFDGLVHPRRVLEAQQRGAAAAVFVNPDVFLHEMIVTTVWGTPAPEDRHRLPRIPVVSVTRPDGDRLRALAGHGPVRLRIHARVDTAWRRLPLPMGRIEGREPTFLLVGAHIDSWHLGATDNATGDAAVLELARVLAAVRDRLHRGFWFCWWPGHSTGRYSGSTWLADTFYRTLRDHCLVYFNIDSPGVRGATEYVARHTSGELEAFNRSRMAEVTGQDVACQRPSRVGDQSFLNMGVPSLAAYSFLPADHPDRRAYAGGSAGAWWWHHEEDTLDKADPEVLAADTRLAARILAELAVVDVIPFSFSRVGDDLAEGLAALRAAAGDAWDWGELEEAVTRFRETAGRFDALGARLAAGAGGATGGDRGGSAVTPDAYNRAGMRLSRIVNPSVYTARGPFGQDPADQAIALRGLSNPVFPTLREVAQLAGAGDPDLAGFLRTRLRREQNRVVAALAEAVELMEGLLEGRRTGR